MWLYHGTYDMFYKAIKKSGAIKPNINSDSNTLELDSFINTIAGRDIRGNCVYLSDDLKTMDVFNRYFRISTSKLDTTRLFIVDNRQLDFILAYINAKMASEYAQRYIKSYIKYRDFLDNKDSYKKIYTPEFLYFGQITLRTSK